MIDLLWFSIASYLWTSDASHDEYLWQSLSGLHNMALIFSFVNLINRVTILL